MSKKDKRKIKEYPWSPYQEAIFSFLENEQGNLVIEACAGSGKSTTLVKCIDLIPKDMKILLSAFNQDIVKDLKKKIKGYDNVDVRTLHSLGLLFLRRNYIDERLIPEPFKYESHIRTNLKNYTSINTFKLNKQQYFKYIDNIKKYVDFGRFYLCQTEKDLDFIEERYGIETIGDEKKIATEVMEWGKANLETIDYTDMIWLPNSLMLKPIGLLYDYIFLDECQDLNKAERELVLKCFKMGTRMISVGDANQTIYSFSGADPNSFDALRNLPNTKTLPLSVSYRCADKIVDFAKKLVPSIEQNNDKREGKIIQNVHLEDVHDGDMLLCRNNAPLIQAYNMFLKIGKKAYIRGKELGTNLKTAVKTTKKDELNTTCEKDGVFARLYDDMFTTRNNLMNKFGIDSETAMKSQVIENKLDIIKALEILSENINTREELITRIDDIFSKKNKNEGVSLSTVHKAKGLEADNVYILCDSLMPSKSAKKEWEVQQEHNLMYVAYTRAKNTLGFIDEKDFKTFDFTSSGNVAILRRMETLVNKTLNKDTKTAIDKETANNIVRVARDLRCTNSNIPKIMTTLSTNQRKINTFADILKNVKNKK